MKIQKVLTSILLLFIVTNLSAQITLTSSDFVSIGDSIFLREALNLNINMTGTGGANQTWDYSTLSTDDQDTIAAISPLNSPWPSSSQFCNIVLERDELYSYIQVNGNKAEVTGVSGDILNLGSPVQIPYIDPILQMTFPADYQDLDVDDGYFSLTGTPTDFGLANLPIQVDSIRVTSSVSVSDLYDGYGDLIIITDTIDCLRRYRTELRVDSLFMIAPLVGPGWQLVPVALLASFPAPYNQSNPTIFDTKKYEWFATGRDYAILTIFADDLTGMTGERALFQWEPALIVSAKETTPKSGFSIFPNPTNGRLNINGIFHENYFSINIYNLLGEIVFTKKGRTNNSNFQLNLDLKIDGLYFLEIKELNSKQLNIVKFRYQK